jgi:hypothetical protein
MGKRAVGAIEMDRFAALEIPRPFLTYRAATVTDPASEFLHPFVTVTKIRAPAEIAVEIFDLMAPLSLLVEGTELGMPLPHVVVPEIGHDRFGLPPPQPFDDFPMPFAKFPVPSPIAHLLSPQLL